jgi:tRNA pseudouridine55 synthase
LTEIDAVLRSFVGIQEQIPPMHSAVHVKGKRLYEYARAGEEVARPVRRIEIEEIHRLFLRGNELSIAVICSKGTYIRTLAMDIGRELGCGASLVGLRRTAAGPLRIEDAVTLAELEQGVEWARARLLPPEILVAGLPRCETTGDDAQRFRQGQVVRWEDALPGSEWALFAPGGRFLGVGRGEAPGLLAPLRLMATGGEPKSPDFA